MEEKEEYHMESHKGCSSRGYNRGATIGYHQLDDNSNNSSSQIQSDSKADNKKQGPVEGLCSF